MLRAIFSAAVVATLALGPASPARAGTPAPGPSPTPTTATVPLASGWSLIGDDLTWTSSERVPMGDAAVEFYAAGRLLGRPTRSPDGRTFRLDLHGPRTFGVPKELKDLQVLAAGRRLDEVGRAEARRRTAPSVPRAPESSPPAAEVDPGTAGPYQTVEGEYALDDVPLPDLPAPVEMKAVVVAPKGAPGRRPLVLLLHGKHDSCFGTPEQGGDVRGWPCPRGTAPVPSNRGYLTTQRLLASQGYLTVSVSADGVNGQDDRLVDGGAQARSSLVRLHLERWARWAAEERSTAPAVVRDAPPADLSRTLLIGHSRGGEGVSRAAMDSIVPPPAAVEGYHGKVGWTIRGMLLIAPTAPGQNPTPNVPSVTILPGCDGDLYDLQGQMYVDATRGLERGNALHGAVYVEGANHNFFNTEWTPGLAQGPAWDDAADPANTLCAPGSPTRLTADRQRTVGATYAATVARLFLTGDDRVRPIVDGTGAVPASVRPAAVHTHAVGGTRRPVVLPSAATRVTGDGARLCAEITDEHPCVDDPRTYIPSPHFARFMFTWGRSEEGRYAVDAKWSAPGTTVSVSAADGARATPGDQLALRVIVPPNTTGTSFTVAVRTSTGTRTAARTVTLDGLPGNSYSVDYWGQEVRVPLTGASGAVAAVELTPTSAAGELWLLDAWTWRPGTPAPARVEAPARVDVGTVHVAEGDSGTRDVDVPVTVTGTGTGTVRVFLVEQPLGAVSTRDVEVRAGGFATSVSIPVTGNVRYGNDLAYEVDVKAVSGTMVGSYYGRLTIDNDDPTPTVTLEPVTASVAEGGTLAWRVRLSDIADGIVYLRLYPRAPAGGAELTTTDVDPTWLTTYLSGRERPEPSRPLSSASVMVYRGIPAGQLTADITVPTVADDVAEPVRSVAFEVRVYQADGTYATVGTLTGSVSDA